MKGEHAGSFVAVVVERGRAFALRMLDVVPGLRRTMDELVRVEVIDRSMIVAAQALLALIPLLIVLAAYLPADMAATIVERFESATGMGGNQTSVVEQAVPIDQVRAETGVAGVVLTLLSATSFARAVQRMYERVWQRPHIGGIVGTRRCFLWLTGWLILLQLVAFLARLLGSVTGFPVARLVLQVIWVTLVWWWTSRALLLGRVSWQRLAPGAILTAVATVIYSAGSTLVMPRYVSSSTSQLGTMGLVLAVATWLIGFAAVMVVANVIGRVIAEDQRIHHAVASLTAAVRPPRPAAGGRSTRPGAG